MADTFSPERRSEIMAAIRSSGTKPEAALRTVIDSILIDTRESFEEQRTDLPGKPDFVIPGLDVAIFADGCFFHACPRHRRLPASHVEYWQAKIERNRLRDQRQRSELRRKGFRVWRVWEHQLKPKEIPGTERMLRRRIEKVLWSKRDGDGRS